MVSPERTELKAMRSEANDPALSDERAVALYDALAHRAGGKLTDEPSLKPLAVQVLEAILLNPNLSFEARTGMLNGSINRSLAVTEVVPRLVDAYARNESLALDQLTGALQSPPWEQLVFEVTIWLLRQYKEVDFWGRSTDGKGGTFDAQPSLEAARRALVDAAKQMGLPHLASIQIRSGLKGQAYWKHAAQFWHDAKTVLNAWLDQHPSAVAKATRLRVTHAVLTEKASSIGKLRLMQPAFWALVDVQSVYRPTLPALAPTLGP